MIYKKPVNAFARFHLGQAELFLSDASIHRTRIDAEGEKSFGYFFKGFEVGHKESVRP